MRQANTFFFLTGCADHINADFRRFDDSTLLVFKRKNDVYDRLELEIVPHATKQHCYIIRWQMDYGASNQAETGVSDAIPQPEIYGVIAAMANGYLPEFGVI